MKPDFSRQVFEKKIKISNIMKIRPVGEEMFDTDGQTHTHTHTDMTKLTVACSNFANTPKNWSFIGTLNRTQIW